jgi:hypothetical protein
MRERVQGALLGIALMFALFAVRILITSMWWGILAGSIVMALFSWTMFYLRDRPPPGQ